MVRKAGRPCEKTGAREKLIDSSRNLFMVQPYDKVSTRMIAERAGVNVAMIRYYFGSKEGLFESMIRETVAPIKAQLERFNQNGNHEGLGDVMRIYYKTMGKNPAFPRLIVQIMNMPATEKQRTLMEKIISDISRPIEELISVTLQEKGIIREGMDPLCCRISFMSLMIFPFLAPPAMYKLHGIELSETFLDKLLEHNIEVLSHGFQNPSPDTFSGEYNEN